MAGGEAGSYVRKGVERRGGAAQKAGEGSGLRAQGLGWSYTSSTSSRYAQEVVEVAQVDLEVLAPLAPLAGMCQRWLTWHRCHPQPRPTCRYRRPVRP